MKKLLFIAVALWGTISGLSAQKVAIMHNGGKDELPEGGTITAYYETKEGITSADIHFYLNPDAAAIGKEYKVTLSKVDHKGDANWGIFLLCMGESCQKVNAYGDVHADGRRIKLEKYEEGEFGYPNEVHPTYEFKEALADTRDDFKVKIDVTPVAGGSPITFYALLRHISKQSTNVIEFAKVALLNEADGLCTLQYTSEGRNLELEVFNILGNLQYKGMLPAGVSAYRLPVRLSQGISIFRISHNGKPVFTQKFRIK